uniref:Uncharacterized protein n=1 Tax=Cacopsylla melanoneura TaxID=428564 RepID=A0A8D8Y7Z2_9HEMI
MGSSLVNTQQWIGPIRSKTWDSCKKSETSISKSGHWKCCAFHLILIIQPHQSCGHLGFHTRRLNDTMLRSNDTMLRSNDTMLRSNDTMLRSNETMLKSNETMLRSNDTMLKSNETMLRSNETMLR